MEFCRSAIPDVVLIKPQVYTDARGFFMETWNARAFARGGLEFSFVQDNHSRSAGGTLRGLHYQIKHPQGKLVRVIAGEIFDVAIDLRRSSATFSKWVGMVLSADNKHKLWVPPGFAHGFYVTSDVAEVEYKCTDFYAPEHERAVRWDDPTLAIEWPIEPDHTPNLAAKDAKAISFLDAEYYE